MPGNNPPSARHAQLVAVLEAASATPIGMTIFTNDPTRARAALYRARMVENNPAYADLQFRAWPYEDGDLVICHSGVSTKKPNNLGSIDLDGILNLNLEG